MLIIMRRPSMHQILNHESNLFFFTTQLSQVTKYLITPPRASFPKSNNISSLYHGKYGKIIKVYKPTT